MVAKELWQMTKEKFFAENAEFLDPKNLSYGSQTHRKWILDCLWQGEILKAIQKGKLIPEEILQDYPDLVIVAKESVNDNNYKI